MNKASFETKPCQDKRRGNEHQTGLYPAVTKLKITARFAEIL